MLRIAYGVEHDPTGRMHRVGERGVPRLGAVAKPRVRHHGVAKPRDELCVGRRRAERDRPVAKVDPEHHARGIPIGRTAHEHIARRRCEQVGRGE
jgi:hypothetical protein